MKKKTLLVDCTPIVDIKLNKSNKNVKIKWLDFNQYKQRGQIVTNVTDFSQYTNRNINFYDEQR